MLAMPAVLCFACSTEKTGFMNEKYHNVTAHYNVWWNGNESLKEAISILDSKVEDDYTRILPIYKTGSKEDAVSVAPQLDRAIEKGASGIAKHSISVRGKEYIEYVKRCYLLMAYAYYYKQDYATSSSTCRMIMNMYSGTDIADEAMILYARCLSMQKEYAEAEMLLDQMDADIASGKVPEKMQKLLYPALADVTLRQMRYKKAIDNLRLCTENIKGKKEQARYFFIMAQVYQYLGKKTTAMKYYEKCLKKRPAYVMDFNARINMASCYDISKGDYGNILKSLDKMLKEKKNYEYRDQIYYAKGEMYLGARDLKNACENFRKSVEVSRNKPQKTKSAVKLGDVLYSEYKDYDEAQKYYDTAVTIMPADYPFEKEVRSRHNILTSLVKNTRVIERNDSLFRMADMDSLEREKYIKKLIEKEKKKEQKRIEAELLESFRESNSSQNKSLKGDWYFYNASTSQRGKESFIKNWGARGLEDFWFLSNKNTVSFDDPSKNDENGASGEGKSAKSAGFPANTRMSGGKFSREYYLKDLPKTQEQRDTMNMDIARCLLSAGFIYNDGVKNPEKALECFLRLAKDYPETDYILPAFYQLYKLYEKQGNTPNANYYKNMILRGFPDSDYSNLILDEDYYLEIAKRAKLSEKEYEDIYRLFTKKRYNDVIARAESAIPLYKDEKLTPKFKFWEALAYAKNGDSEPAIKVLEDIVSNHPKTEIMPRVQDNLALLKSGKFENTDQPQTMKTDINDGRATTKVQLKDTTDSQKAKAEKLRKKKEEELKQQEDDKEDDLPPESQMYRYRADIQHYVIVILDDKKIPATEMQYSIADFNTTYYSTKGLRANALLFTSTQQLITVNRFNNAEDALEYWKILTKDGGYLKRFDKADYKSFVISIQNYQTFYNQKNIEAYDKFYQKYYMGEGKK